MSDLDRLLAQVEELKRLAQRPDDSWMNAMSTDELQALGKRVRKVADGLTGLQQQMIQKNRGASTPPGVRPPVSRAPSPVQRSASGSLGSIVRRDSSGPAAGGGGMDLSNPMGRRGGGSIPPEAPPARRPGGPASSAPSSGQSSAPKAGWKPPWAEPGNNPPDGGRGRNRPTF